MFQGVNDGEIPFNGDWHGDKNWTHASNMTNAKTNWNDVLE